MPSRVIVEGPDVMIGELALDGLLADGASYVAPELGAAARHPVRDAGERGGPRGDRAAMSTAVVAEPAGAAERARGDVFALGCVLWELLAGRRLFHAETATSALAVPASLASSRAAEVPPLADVPAALAAIVERAVATDTRARYATPAQLGAALADYLVEVAAN